MRHFATLFDSAYAAKGLALHESLLRHSSEDWQLHILCLDMDTFWLLSEMKLKNVELIPLGPFERALKLEPVRDSRTHQEYAWTLASCLMEYLLPSFDALTYLDSDIYFFSDPKVIHEEVGEKSIGITPHRFNQRDEKRLGSNGTYNVGVVVSKATPTGLRCISRWAEQCREWCFSRNEKGKFGDQAYLDSWPQDCPGEVCVIENFGVNLGPWAIGNYIVEYVSGCVQLTKSTSLGSVCELRINTLVAYHFHEFQGPDQLTNWKLRPEDKELIYAPYVKAYLEAKERISQTQVILDRRHSDAAHESVTA